MSESHEFSTLLRSTNSGLHAGVAPLAKGHRDSATVYLHGHLTPANQPPATGLFFHTQGEMSWTVCNQLKEADPPPSSPAIADLLFFNLSEGAFSPKDIL